ncbi:uncharacterized protein LOC101848743 [Aplysia californica]|uniref:Uncharacterized protein LOC101848743 n=1 Tax=Aplysia californica TaxID=6500 RepID=A0ABM0ZY33_APLCA|nr:uncharacterized protein LOC101848743 [Aplysia californica]
MATDAVSPVSIESAGEMATASLSEVLATRGRFLEEQELWALCRECCLTLEYVNDCHDLFQTLCISPDTVAFDPEGNVCFLDLDLEPEQLYVAPESSEYGSSSFKSHLFSLGMTLLYATEYNTQSDDPRAALGDVFTDLLTTLTNDDPDLRPSLDTVIEACELSLGEESSQEICLKIIGYHGTPDDESESKEQSSSSLQQMTDELTAYLQSQSNFVQPKASLSTSPSTAEGTPQQNSIVHSDESSKNDSTPRNVPDSTKDLNHNCLKNQQQSVSSKNTKNKASRSQGILRDASFDEEESVMENEVPGDVTTPRRARRQQGIMLADVMDSLDHFLDESELWALCRESILCLQRKKKHLPAYISPDTVMVRESGTIGFKAIPEEKPLEVIYMAPELQQKGILNEKTCLYGLGVTVKSAAGGKYSSSLAVPDGEALDILVQSFLCVNPDKRPDLETAMEMCDEYEKVKRKHSKEVCQKIYKDALESASSNKSNQSSTSVDLQTHKDSKAHPQNSWDEVSSDNTQSIAHGNHSELEDNIEDIPFDDNVDDTISPTSAFKNVGVKNPVEQIPPSAFKPVAVKPKPIKDQYRVPSAFSSPATHFKPIVIHESTSNPKDSMKNEQLESTVTSTMKETDVVAKLREIKHNLLKHRTTEISGKEEKEVPKHVSRSGVDQSKGDAENNHVRPAGEGSSDIGSALKELQSQGQLPSTDVLATAIAQYLRTHIVGASASNEPACSTTQSSGQTEPAPASLTGSVTSTRTMPAYSVESLQQHPLHSIHTSQPHGGGSTVSTTATSINMSLQQMPLSASTVPQQSQQYTGTALTGTNNPFLPTTMSSAQAAPAVSLTHLPVPYQLPTSSVSPSNMHMTTPFSGVPPGNVPVQFTLMQDPVTGIMQMVPVPYIPFSQTSSAHSVSPRHSESSGVLTGAGASVLPGTGARLFSMDSINASAEQNLNSSADSGKLEKGAKRASDVDNRRLQKNHDASLANNDYPQMDRKTDRIRQAQPPGENDSQSSSPSPSKDSGICLTQLAASTNYNNDSLMERLLSSENSQRQGTLSRVVRILREEFVEDGMFDTGVEDLAIAEYILALSSLSWDTFCSAVTEKYFHLVWTYDLLSSLFDAIGGGKPSNLHFNSKTLPAKKNRPFSHRSVGEAERKLRQSEPDLQSAINQEVEYGKGSHQAPQHHGHNLGLSGDDKRLSGLRPKSEIGRRRGIWSETSDSTDSEARDKKRRFKKRCELDKSKSSSVHNIPAGSFSSVAENTGMKTEASLSGDVQHNDKNLNNPSVFSKDYFQARPKSNVPSTHSGTENTGLSSSPNVSLNKRPGHGSSTVSPNSSIDSPKGLRGSGKYARPPSEFVDQNQGHSTPVLPSKGLPNRMQQPLLATAANNGRQSSHHRSASSDHPQSANSGFLSPSSSQNNPISSSQLLVKIDYAHSSSSNSPEEERSRSYHLSSSAGLIKSKTVLSESAAEVADSSSKFTDSQSKRTPAPTAPVLRGGRGRYDHSDGGNDQSSDSDFNTSAEMRRLSAKKPELFDDRRTSGYSTPIDSMKKLKSPSQQSSIIAHSHLPQPFQTRQRVPPPNSNVDTRHRNFNSSNSSSGFDTPNKRFSGTENSTSPTQYEPSQPGMRTRRDHVEDQGPRAQYGRSLSAVYSRPLHGSESGVKVIESSDYPNSSSHHRRGSDGSTQLQEINCALMPYTKRGQVVYHSAMIQLSLTAEVDKFIHSIDEENKHVIESRLASINQEISMQRRERKKTQRFYRKLTESATSSKSGRSDQNVSDQMLRDMTDMTRKLSFLQLCQTHLQMLLAELNGLDSCFLYSLSASEGMGPLSLQVCRENPYLQFRTINTPNAGKMSILQAGTPRGLMSYLYTSSALSDGYIHQFLLCFRYILTAEQLLTFITEKYRSAQSGNQEDPNMNRICRRSLDFLLFWMEGYYSIDFAPNTKLVKKLAEFLKEQTDKNADGADDLFNLYAACRMSENVELMLNTEAEEDEDEENNYFLRMVNPKRWESFRSLLKRSKSDKSKYGLLASSAQSKSDLKVNAVTTGGLKSAHQFSVSDCPVHTLAEQLTLLEQELFRKSHPVHFLNSQFQGVGVSLTMPGMRTPSMSRKADSSSSPKRGLFVGEPAVESWVVHMICHSHELAHWVSAEILSCGSHKVQGSMITKFLTVAHMCLEVRNFASALSILDGLENLVVKQLPVWKNISTKYLGYMDLLSDTKMKIKSEAMWLMSEKDCHVYPTIPCVLYASLHLQQVEIGGFTLANGMFKWDKMRSISELVDQVRIFRDHEYGFEPDPETQRALRRRLSEFSDQDLHAVASTQETNFRRHSSSSSLSGTLKKVKDKLHSKKK